MRHDKWEPKTPLTSRSQQLYATQYLRHWTVPSKSDPQRQHTVGLTHAGRLVCTCRNWKFRHGKISYRPCDHIKQVLDLMVYGQVDPFVEEAVSTWWSRMARRWRR